MRIKLTSIHVNDQKQALQFYTDVLGFVKKADFTQGPFRWLTVASPEEPDGAELQLALNDNPAARTYPELMRRTVSWGAVSAGAFCIGVTGRDLSIAQELHGLGPISCARQRANSAVGA